MTSVQLTYIPRSGKYQQLNKLLSEDWAMLLDSGAKDLDPQIETKSLRRYDIAVCDPSVKLTVNHTGSIIEKKNGQQQSSNLKPLQLMRELLVEYTPSLDKKLDAGITEDLPFQGGWLGYISYDFGIELLRKSLKNIEQQQKIDTPSLPLISMGLYQWAIISDHKNKTTKIYNFGLDKEYWGQLKSKIISKLKETPMSVQQSTYLTSKFKSNLSFNNYAESFQKIKDYIYAGDCYQVNFAQKFAAEFNGKASDIYTILANENNSPFSAYLNFSDQQVLSFSPERFIESRRGKVITQPIKGTLPRATDPQLDKLQAKKLLNSEKDRAENLMIVDLLRNDLSKTSTKGSVKVTELFGLYNFESVHHLISTVESKLDDKFDNFDLLATTLPGGSITGAPKIRAMQIINELEKTQRGVYCGIIGYIDFNGNMDTNICIRTLVADKNTLYCWAGGGLVADSQLEQEYQETFDKLNKILPVLNGLEDNPTRIVH